jgi:hypothetical protein
LSTNFEDSDALFQTISNPKYKNVGRYRINRRGADIAKESAIAIISKSINFSWKEVICLA